MKPTTLIPLAVAGLSSVTALAQWTLEQVWSHAPGATLAEGVNLGGAGSNTERGLAYNPVTGNVLVVSRTDSTKIIRLNGATGAYLGTLDLTGVAGGTFPLNMIDVADDGKIYAANLTTSSSTSPFKVYQWVSEAAAPANIYTGDPAGGTFRFGDTFRVRGSGASTEIIAGAGGTANTDNILARLSTSDGDTFAAQGIPISGIGDGDLRLGLSFGAGNTVYGDQGNTLRYVSYDPVAGTGTLLASYTLVSGAGTPGPNAVYLPNNLLASLTFRTGAGGEHRVNLYDLSVFTDGGSFNPIDFAVMPTENANINGVGNLDFTPDGSMLFVVSPNNGIVAYKVVPEPGTTALLGLSALALLAWRRR